MGTSADETELQVTAPTARNMGTDVDAAAAGLEQAPDDGRPRGHVMSRAARLPVLTLRVIAHDVSSAARRPDTVVYWGGLAALAALGALDWPVSAAIGVGVAVGGVRRARG